MELFIQKFEIYKAVFSGISYVIFSRKRFIELFIFTNILLYYVLTDVSAVMNILKISRNHLKITNRGDLVVYLTNIEPDIEEMLTYHQPQ